MADDELQGTPTEDVTGEAPAAPPAEESPAPAKKTAAKRAPAKKTGTSAATPGVRAERTPEQKAASLAKAAATRAATAAAKAAQAASKS